ncbi:LysR family transcriptional regulator [Bordetella genomosp. 9]|uniref:LysR family transcriptional regulator n=1 Tax=Bordetella genomosp. 9 TaxID=1416803 RepID=UPI000A297690|nr:LysR family transcriptional regulator [Bordetella genomosp. 9]ARP92413.1 LysR family transcriptional regulator [Bordetella genomosp. 9]
MDTRFLDSFVMVAECGSMAEAARRMNITPTALAQRIRSLEREFGLPLFTRSGRFVRITEGGARLLARAGHFQRELRQLKAATLADGFPGGLRIGTIRTALTNVLPEWLTLLAKRHPDLDASLEIGASHELYHQVASGKLDAAVLVEPPFRVPKSFRWQPMRVEPLILLAPARLVKTEPDALLAAQPFLRYDRRTWGGMLADQYLRQRGLTPRERFEMDSPDGIAILVGRGLGVSLVPDCYRPGSLPRSVAAVPVGGSRLARRLGMLWPARSPYGRLFEALMDEAPRAAA